MGTIYDRAEIYDFYPQKLVFENKNVHFSIFRRSEKLFFYHQPFITTANISKSVFPVFTIECSLHLGQ